MGELTMVKPEYENENVCLVGAPELSMNTGVATALGLVLGKYLYK